MRCKEIEKKELQSNLTQFKLHPSKFNKFCFENNFSLQGIQVERTWDSQCAMFNFKEARNKSIYGP